MGQNIIAPPHKIKEAMDRFLNLSRPYYNAIAEIEQMKPVKYLFNFETGLMTPLKTEDTKVQSQLKDFIQIIYDDCFKSITESNV